MLKTSKLDTGHGYRDGFPVPASATIIPQPKPNPRPVEEDEDDEHFDHRADMVDMEGLDEDSGEWPAIADQPGREDDGDEIDVDDDEDSDEDSDEDGCDEPDDDEAPAIAASGEPWYRAPFSIGHDAVFYGVPAE